MVSRKQLQSVRKKDKKPNYLKTRVYCISDTSVMSCIKTSLPLIFLSTRNSNNEKVLLSLHQESCSRSRVALIRAEHIGSRVGWTPHILVPFNK